MLSVKCGGSVTVHWMCEGRVAAPGDELGTEACPWSRADDYVGTTYPVSM